MSKLIENYLAVCRQLVEVAATAARPQPELIAVSKTFPAADVRELYAAGQRHFGENYLQEFADKAAELADLAELQWHVIGHIQSNKSRLVAEHAAWVHTIDREKIARRLSEQRPPQLPPLQVLIEVNIGGEAGKHGIAPEEAVLQPLAFQVAALPNLRLRGLMCVAKTGSDARGLRQQFERMGELLADLQAQGLAVDVLSMGMSADLAEAVACGATHVRIGSAIFGQREAKTSA